VKFVIPPKYHKNSQKAMIKFYLHFSCKVDVNGEDAAPIYKFLKSSKTGPFGDKQGRVAERYAPTTYPLSIQVSSEPSALQIVLSSLSFPLSSDLIYNTVFCASLQKDIKKLLGSF
jgi:glutathione peroxidase